jgi:hypothetical protein
MASPNVIDQTEGDLPAAAIRSPGTGARSLIGFLAVAAILALDAWIWRVPVPRWALGAGDETAHLITAALALSAWYSIRRTRPPREFLASALVFAVLIDTDHVPGEIFHNEVISRGTYRPYGHTLLVVAALVVAAALAPKGRARHAMRGIGVGVALHLLRDLPTGGIPMFWPIVDQTVRYPYYMYIAMLLVAAAAPLAMARPKRSAASAETSAART